MKEYTLPAVEIKISPGATVLYVVEDTVFLYLISICLY